MQVNGSAGNVVSDPVVPDPKSPGSNTDGTKLSAPTRISTNSLECFEDLSLHLLGEFPEVVFEPL